MNTEQEHTADDLQHEAEHTRPRKRGSVMVYLAILFAAAFLLLLMSYFMQQRINRETLDDLQKTSTSAVQSLDNLIAERDRLVQERQTLEEQLEELEGNIRLQKFYHQNPSAEKMLELDNEFHRMLFWIANKKQAYEMMDRITIHFDRVRNLAISAVKEHKWMEEHYEIYKRIRDNDPDQAARLMEQHLQRYQVDEGTIRRSYPQYFKQHK